MHFPGEGSSGPWSGGPVGNVIATALLILAAGVLASCGGSGGTTAASPGPSASSTSGSNPVINWAALPRSPVVLDGPWTAVQCEGSASLLCIRRNGSRVGAVELLTHPDAHPAGTEPIAYLTQIVADFQRGVATNRQATCANSSTFSALPVQEVAINGGVGLKSDWSITNAAGLVVQRQITYFALGRTTVASLGATALVPGATCVESLGSEFTPPVMADAVPVLDRVAAESRFSSG